MACFNSGCFVCTEHYDHWALPTKFRFSPSEAKLSAAAGRWIGLSIPAATHSLQAEASCNGVLASRQLPHAAPSSRRRSRSHEWTCHMQAVPMEATPYMNATPHKHNKQLLQLNVAAAQKALLLQCSYSRNATTRIYKGSKYASMLASACVLVPKKQGLLS